MKLKKGKVKGGLEDEMIGKANKITGIFNLFINGF